jgi:hypothetical protein
MFSNVRSHNASWIIDVGCMWLISPVSAIKVTLPILIKKDIITVFEFVPCHEILTKWVHKRFKYSTIIYMINVDMSRSKWFDMRVYGVLQAMLCWEIWAFCEEVVKYMALMRSITALPILRSMLGLFTYTPSSCSLCYFLSFTTYQKSASSISSIWMHSFTVQLFRASI